MECNEAWLLQRPYYCTGTTPPVTKISGQFSFGWGDDRGTALVPDVLAVGVL